MKLLFSHLFFVLLLFFFMSPVSAKWIPPEEKQEGGPVVLMGIDSEDSYGRELQHGSLDAYKNIVNKIQSHVLNGNTKILVIGAGKSWSDDVTSFWRELTMELSSEVIFVNGNQITNTKFDDFGLVVVVSDYINTPKGGLTVSEQEILLGKQNEFKEFINNGGGLLGFASSFENYLPYAYLPIPEGQRFKVNVNVDAPNTMHRGYKDLLVVNNDWQILKDELELCCWHDNFVEFPEYLDVLAIDKYNSEASSSRLAAAIGGTRVIIDNEPPVTKIDIHPIEKKGKEGWFNYQDNVSFTLNSVDKFPGVYETKYRINNGSWMNYTVGDKISINQEGSSISIDYYSIDKAGLEEKVNTKHIKIDRTLPEIKTKITPSTPNENGWYNLKSHQVNVTLEANDTLSGINKTYIKTNTMDDFIGYTSIFNVTLKEGNNRVIYYSEDRAGNPKEGVRDLKADLTKPTTTAAITPEANENGWYNLDAKNVKIALNANDKLSGIDKTYYKTDGMNDFEEYKGTIDVSLDEGINTISYYSVDKAGNNEEERKVELKADLTKPVTTPTLSSDPNKNDWYNNDVKVSLEGEDNLSGIAYTEYNSGSGWVKYTSPFTISLDGVHTIEYRSVDIAGNTEDEKSITIKIDKTLPSINLSVGEILWPPNHKMVDIDVNIITKDELSGIDYWLLKSIESNEFENDTGDGNHVPDFKEAEIGKPDVQFELRSERSGKGEGRKYTITYMVIDKAGNKSTVSEIIEVTHDQSNKKNMR